MPSIWNRRGGLSERPALDMTPQEARSEVIKLRMRVAILEREIERGRPLTASEQLDNLTRAVLADADDELAPISGRR